MNEILFQHVVFLDLEVFFAKKREEIIRDTQDETLLNKYLNDLEVARLQAIKRRGGKIYRVAAVTAGVAATAGAAGAGITTAAVFAKVGGCCAMTALGVGAGIAVATFFVGGAVVGLLALGGMFAYVKFKDRQAKKYCPKSLPVASCAERDE